MPAGSTFAAHVHVHRIVEHPGHEGGALLYCEYNCAFEPIWLEVPRAGTLSPSEPTIDPPIAAGHPLTYRHPPTATVSASAVELRLLDASLRVIRVSAKCQLIVDTRCSHGGSQPDLPPQNGCLACEGSTPGLPNRLAFSRDRYPPPPCACTALSKHGVGVEPPF